MKFDKVFINNSSVIPNEPGWAVGIRGSREREKMRKRKQQIDDKEDSDSERDSERIDSNSLLVGDGRDVHHKSPWHPIQVFFHSP